MKINKTEVFTEVVSIIKDLGLKTKSINNTSQFRGDLKGDSLDVLELVIITEEHYGINIDSSEIPNDFSIGFFTEIVFEKLNQKRIDDHGRRQQK